MERILVVEDEDSIARLITLSLEAVGYAVSVVGDGESCLEKLEAQAFDLVILDIMLPGRDGFELLPHISAGGTPVILVTAKAEIGDKIRGLNLGADDYITKPFECMELIARVKAVLRRAGQDKHSTLSFDDIQIYPESRRVVKSDTEVALTPLEFDLLVTLAENAGIALSRERLLEMVWDYQYGGNTRTVDIHIQKLRQKLGTGRITTVYKMGYRMETLP